MTGPAGELDESTAALSKVYGVRDLGNPSKKFTGIQLEYREDGSMLLHQSDGNTSFLDDCETGGALTKGRPVPLVPMADGIDLTAYAEKGVVPPNDNFFRFAVGYIGCTVSRTLPQLAYSFLKLSAAVGRNTPKHDADLMHVLLWLRGHVTDGLLYGATTYAQGTGDMVGYADASYVTPIRPLDVLTRDTSSFFEEV